MEILVQRHPFVNLLAKITAVMSSTKVERSPTSMFNRST